MSGRAERLRARLPALGAASFLVTDPVSVRWLTGFESSNAAVLVGPERPVLLTDGRYVEAARGLPGVEVIQAERDVATTLAARLGELAAAPVAFEADRMTVAEHETVAASGVALVPAKRVVKELRAVKDEAELEAIRRSARILVDAFERLAGERLAGRTEADVAWWLERAIRDEGAEALSFEPIVASGPNAALPHHHPGGRVIGAGETVIVDAGAQVDGYASDCTRTFATGPLPDDLRRAYAACRRAQDAALAALRAGAAARDLDAIARTRLEDAGFEVLHGLGHGVGLDVHELPVLNKVSEDVLEAGNVVTVEPGVYLAGRGGVRIEDLVVVGEGGPEVLTRFTKDLVVLD